jgi:N-acetylglutamate synthase-like GNAT family acetyltransferase
VNNLQIKCKPKLEAGQIDVLRVAVGWQAPIFDYTIALERSFSYYGVLEDQNLIGFLNVISDGVSYALIVDVMVHPAYQRLGIGKQLLQTAIQDLQTTNVARVCVMFDESLQNFYTSLGFTNLEGGMLKLER